MRACACESVCVYGCVKKSRLAHFNTPFTCQSSSASYSRAAHGNVQVERGRESVSVCTCYSQRGSVVVSQGVQFAKTPLLKAAIANKPFPPHSHSLLKLNALFSCFSSLEHCQDTNSALMTCTTYITCT